MNYLKTSELAERLRVSYATVRRIIKRGDIACVVVGGQLRISENALEEYLRNNAKTKR